MDDRAAEIKRIAAGMLAWPLRALFPPLCLACRVEVMEPGALCGRCWPKLRFIDEPWCPVMGTPFSHDLGQGILSAEAIVSPPPFRRARSAVVYDGVARDLVQSLKFRDRTELAPWMARWMRRAGRELLGETDVVTAVPLHRRRYLWRRFNQSAELARALVAGSGLVFDPALIVRTRPTRQQVGLLLSERHDNVRGAFRVPVQADIAVRGRRVLLVDDVYTTGATLMAATRALRRAGAASVEVLTFARVLPGDFRPDDEPTISTQRD